MHGNMPQSNTDIHWHGTVSSMKTTENRSFFKSTEKKTTAELIKSWFMAGNLHSLRKRLKEKLEIKDFIQEKGDEHTFFFSTLRHSINQKYLYRFSRLLQGFWLRIPLCSTSRNKWKTYFRDVVIHTNWSLKVIINRESKRSRVVYPGVMIIHTQVQFKQTFSFGLRQYTVFIQQQNQKSQLLHVKVTKADINYN